ncbi:MAG: VWA domain-containing protein, partial [Pyrinomonadaceae bacterium]
AFFPNSREEMDEAFERIALELRSQYSISYRPTDLGSKRRWHRIKVKLTPRERFKRLRIRSREGYYAPR